MQYASYFDGGSIAAYNLIIIMHKRKMKSMKSIIGILGLVLAMSSCSVYRDIAPKEMRSKTGIYKVEGKQKDELYMKANLWLVETFNSAESVIQYSDKEYGVISGKFHTPIFTETGILTIKAGNTYNSIITIKASDGQYEVAFKNPRIITTNVPPTTRHMKLLAESWQDLIRSLVLYAQERELVY